MKLRRMWMVVTVFAVLFAVPRPAHAGIGEFIWEMSGPQMVGFPVECRIGMNDGELYICTFLGIPLRKTDRGLTQIPERPIWLFLEGGPYFSTGKNATNEDTTTIFAKFDEFMLTFDPLVAIQSVPRTTSRNWAMYHGVLGMSYNFMVGPNFKSFSNVAFKLRPVGLTIGKKFTVEYNVRLYPNGFDSDDFGKPPTPSTGRTELVQGLSAFYFF